MKESYRITTPELIMMPSEIIPDRTVYHRVETVLWRGHAEPTQEVVDAQLEGQKSVREQNRISGQDSPVVPLGNEIYIKHRGKFPLMGWKVVRVVQI